MRPSVISKPAAVVGAKANGSGEQLSTVPRPAPVRISGLGSSGSGLSIFRRKTERLDWRQIASVDIHTLLHCTSEAELNALLVSELLPQIAYCSIEDELLEERGKLDPGFVKVFQIAQLLIEFLLHQHHVAFEAQQQLEEQCARLGQEKEEQSKLMAALREALRETRRVLRKRKKYLQIQNEGFGARSKGEYEKAPCPYCIKKFISPTFLHAHMQKRHQGLSMPADPLFVTLPLQQQPHSVHFMPTNTETGSNFDNLKQAPAPELVTMSTQTDRDVQAVKADVEELSKRLQAQTQRERSGPTATATSGDDAEGFGTQVNRDITRLASRIQESGFEEFKQEFIEEIKKMKDMIASSAAKGAEMQETKTQANEIGETGMGRPSSQQEGIGADSVQDFRERFLKQEKELEALRHSMQVKMQEDVVAFDGKLQAQERFWRMKLRQVEEQYEAQAGKLREEVQAAIAGAAASNINATSRQPSDVSVGGNSKEGRSQIQIQGQDHQAAEGDLSASPTPTPVQTSTPKKSGVEAQVLMVRPKTARRRSPTAASSLAVPSPTPKARPRTPQPVPRRNSLPKTLQSESQPQQEAETERLESLELETGIGTVTHHEHEYEEAEGPPQGQDADKTQVSDYQTTDLEDEDEDDGDGEDFEQAEVEEFSHSQSEGENDVDAVSELRRLNLQLYDKRAELEQERMHQRRIQAEVVKELGEKMKKLGLLTSSVDEDGNENGSSSRQTAELEDVTKALVELKRLRGRRSSEGNDTSTKEQLRTHVNFLAAAQSIENQFESRVQSGDVFRHQSLSHSHALLPPPQLPLPLSTPSKSKGRAPSLPPSSKNTNSNSPIIKMLSAVKQKGAGWKKKFVTSIKGKGDNATGKTKATARKVARTRSRTPTTAEPRPHPQPFTFTEPEPSGLETFHEEMLEAETRKAVAAKKSFFSRTKAKLSGRSGGGGRQKGTPAAAAAISMGTESVRRARNLRQDLQESNEEEDEDGIRPALRPLAVASPTRPRPKSAKERTPAAAALSQSHYSKPMKVKAILGQGQSQAPRIFSANALPPPPQTVAVSGSGVGVGVTSMYPSEETAQDWDSSGSESDSESEGLRKSEELRQIAKSLSDRRNNPETQTAAGPQSAYYSHYQKHGAGAGSQSQSQAPVVKRNLLQDFNTAEERWQGLYSRFQAQQGEVHVHAGKDGSEEEEEEESKTEKSESEQYGAGDRHGDLNLREHDHERETDNDTSKAEGVNSNTSMSEDAWSITLKRLQMQK